MGLWGGLGSSPPALSAISCQAPVSVPRQRPQPVRWSLPPAPTPPAHFLPPAPTPQPISCPPPPPPCFLAPGPCAGPHRAARVGGRGQRGPAPRRELSCQAGCRLRQAPRRQGQGSPSWGLRVGQALGPDAAALGRPPAAGGRLPAARSLPGGRRVLGGAAPPVGRPAGGGVPGDELHRRAPPAAGGPEGQLVPGPPGHGAGPGPAGERLRQRPVPPGPAGPRRGRLSLPPRPAALGAALPAAGGRDPPRPHRSLCSEHDLAGSAGEHNPARAAPTSLDHPAAGPGSRNRSHGCRCPLPAQEMGKGEPGMTPAALGCFGSSNRFCWAERSLVQSGNGTFNPGSPLPCHLLLLGSSAPPRA